tara:strand:- start:34319 stop:34678 length:360 start_codon:yes stop_codon:yes gene_type:complete
MVGSFWMAVLRSDWFRAKANCLKPLIRTAIAAANWLIPQPTRYAPPVLIFRIRISPCMWVVIGSSPVVMKPVPPRNCCTVAIPELMRLPSLVWQPTPVILCAYGPRWSWKKGYGVNACT